MNLIDSLANGTMNLTALLNEMRQAGTLNEGQSTVLEELHRGRRYSVHWELRAAVYVGVLLVAAGVALTVREYFAQLGDVAIIGSLAAACLASFAYCFLKGGPWSRGEVESPNLFFDYVLLFGCTCFATAIGYVEAQFTVLGKLWIHYLLISAALFFFLAYRFDNRLVLSMALSTLAAWFGFQLSETFLHFHRYWRESAIAYGAVTFGLGFALHRAGLKRHFFQVYLHFAVNVLLVALVSGVAEYRFASWHLPALAAAVAAVAVYSVRTRRFSYMLYAILYGFAGLTSLAVRFIHDTGVMFLYGIGSSLAVIALIFFLSRRYKEGA